MPRKSEGPPHPSYLRLVAVARSAGVNVDDAPNLNRNLAEWLGTDTTQVVSNWRGKRGVSRDGALSVERKVKRRVAGYILHGEEQADLLEGERETMTKPSTEPVEDSGESDHVRRSVEYAVDALGAVLSRADAGGRKIAAAALEAFASNPDGEKSRLVRTLLSALPDAPQPPTTPTTSPKGRKKTAKGESASSRKASLSVKVGGGQQQMFDKPRPKLSEVLLKYKPISKREDAFYKHLEATPKASAGRKNKGEQT